MRKRYMLFTYERFYPSGGLSDLRIKFDTYEEIEEWAENTKYFDRFWDFLDLDTGITLEAELYSYDEDDDDDNYIAMDEDKRRCYKLINQFFSKINVGN